MRQNLSPQQRPRIVIVGAGFGGLATARNLAGAPADVLLLDRNNYHAFWPLLYQVATAGLEPQDVVQPVRSILRNKPNIDFRVTTVQSIDLDGKVVHTDSGPVSYDELVLSPGTTNNFFGLEEVERQAYGFKDLPEALAIRNHIITRFERAEGETDPETLRRLLTFVVIGGGPTGVELAGAISELIRHVIRRDHPRLDFSHVRVVLVEALDRVLTTFPPSLSARAMRTLERLGVEVLIQTSVAGMREDALLLKDGSEIPSDTVIWAAGVKATALGAELGVELQRGGRVPVTPTLQLEDHPEVWIAGDLAYLPGADGKPLPQLAAVAMQQGRHIARNIRRKLRGEPLLPFRYTDKGSMATVGRRSAVARIWGMNFSGALAWYLWLGVHLLYLVGLRNRLLVLMNWAYNYFTYDRAARAVIAPSRHARAALEVEAVANAPVQLQQPDVSEVGSPPALAADGASRAYNSI